MQTRITAGDRLIGTDIMVTLMSSSSTLRFREMIRLTHDWLPDIRFVIAHCQHQCSVLTSPIKQCVIMIHEPLRQVPGLYESRGRMADYDWLQIINDL